MKRTMTIIVLVVIILLATFSTVLAGGDQNQGEIGAGETHEVCGTQPGCNEDVVPPGPGPDWMGP